LTVARCDSSRENAIEMSKWLVTVGLVLLLLGLAWPLLQKLGLGSLPGDIRIERKGTVFYFPITSCIIVSLVISVILWIFRR
jgi:hypothetical protein